jgi:hypothetical protein
MTCNPFVANSLPMKITSEDNTQKQANKQENKKLLVNQLLSELRISTQQR